MSEFSKFNLGIILNRLFIFLVLSYAYFIDTKLLISPLHDNNISPSKSIY